MPIIYNIDKHDAAYNTNAPFEYSCPLKLGNNAISPASFLSIKIYCNENIRPPARLYGITMNSDDSAEVEFRDADGMFIGAWHIYPTNGSNSTYVSGFIYDANDVLTGHIYCTADTPALLRSAARLGGDSIVTDPSDFVLLPQCHMSCLTGAMRSISVNGSTHTGKVSLVAGKYIKDGSTTAINMNCIGKYSKDESASTVKNGVTKLVLTKTVDSTDCSQAYDVAGKHVIIKSGITSNLRVVRDESTTIVLKGVS